MFFINNKLNIAEYKAYWFQYLNWACANLILAFLFFEVVCASTPFQNLNKQV